MSWRRHLDRVDPAWEARSPASGSPKMSAERQCRRAARILCCKLCSEWGSALKKISGLGVIAVRRLGVLGAVLGMIGPVGAETVPPADIVVVHAKVYTVNPRDPWAQAVAIGGGKIIAVGTDEQIEAYRGSSTRVIDAGQRMVLPGLIDAHVHFFGAVWQPVIFGFAASTVAQVQEQLRA